MTTREHKRDAGMMLHPLKARKMTKAIDMRTPTTPNMIDLLL